MGNSVLITGSTVNNREDKILQITKLKKLEETANVMILSSPENKNSIGISKIRESATFLEEKPYSGNSKALIILHASEMTTAAQNALLKTLEEPPDYATIVLESKSEKGLLDTVLSRCKRIRIQSSESESPEDESYLKFLSSDTGERLYWSNELSKEDRDVIIDRLEAFIRYCRKQLKDSYSSDYSHNISKLLEIKESIEDTNVNPQNALDYLALELKID